MKLTWNDVKPYFEEVQTLTSGRDLYWYQYVWQLLSENKLTHYYSLAEKLVVYGRIYAAVKIYKEFCKLAFDESLEFDLYLEGLTDDRDRQDIYDDLIKSDDAMYTVFEVLQANVGLDKTFCSLWTTWEHEELDTQDSYEDYTNALNHDLDNILNHDMSIGKQVSYEWLSSYMQG